MGISTSLFWIRGKWLTFIPRVLGWRMHVWVCPWSVVYQYKVPPKRWLERRAIDTDFINPDACANRLQSVRGTGTIRCFQHLSVLFFWLEMGEILLWFSLWSAISVLGYQQIRPPSLTERALPGWHACRDQPSPSRLSMGRTSLELFQILVFRIMGLLCPLGKCAKYKSQNHQTV